MACSFSFCLFKLISSLSDWLQNENAAMNGFFFSEVDSYAKGKHSYSELVRSEVNLLLEHVAFASRVGKFPVPL